MKHKLSRRICPASVIVLFIISCSGGEVKVPNSDNNSPLVCKPTALPEPDWLTDPPAGTPDRLYSVGFAEPVLEKNKANSEYTLNNARTNARGKLTEELVSDVFSLTDIQKYRNDQGYKEVIINRIKSESGFQNLYGVREDAYYLKEDCTGYSLVSIDRRTGESRVELKLAEDAKENALNNELPLNDRIAAIESALDALEIIDFSLLPGINGDTLKREYTGIRSGLDGQKVTVSGIFVRDRELPEALKSALIAKLKQALGDVPFLNHDTCDTVRRCADIAKRDGIAKPFILKVEFIKEEGSFSSLIQLVVTSYDSKNFSSSPAAKAQDRYLKKNAPNWDKLAENLTEHENWQSVLAKAQ